MYNTPSRYPQRIKLYILVMVTALIIIGIKLYFVTWSTYLEQLSVSAKADIRTGSASEVKKAKLKESEVDKKCQKISLLSDAELANAKLGYFGDKIENVKKHSLCFQKQFGIIDDKGTLLKRNIKEYFTDHYDAAVANKVISSCIYQSTTPIQTSWTFTICVFSTLYG